MPWCPKCKYEYREGFTVCADCGVKLVEKLEEERTEENYNTQLDISNSDIENSNCDLFSSETEISNDSETEKENLIQKDKKQYQLYVDPAKRADEHKATAISLLFIGIIGLCVIILMATGILSLDLKGLNMGLIYIVMGILFIIFIILGISSIASYRNLSKLALSEDDKNNKIKNYLRTTVQAENFDADLMEAGLTDELLYFKRIEKLKEYILKYDSELESNYIDYIIEDMYSEIFDK